MKNIYKIVFLLFAIVGCTNLDEELYNDLTKSNYYTNKEEVQAAFMNQYQFLREMCTWDVFYLQELTTDEACLPQKGRDGYDGGRYQRLHWHTWTDQDEIIDGAWEALYRGIGYCNQFIEDISQVENVIIEEEKDIMLAETRGVRSLYYFYLLDLYGNVPVVEKVGIENPANKSRVEVYNFVESELLDIRNMLLSGSNSSNYGRFTEEAAMALLSRLYLNAEIYTGNNKLTECIAISNELLTKHFALENNWEAPFVWDNDNSTENIFVLPNDETYATEMSAIFYRNIHWSQRSQWEWNNATGGWNAIVTEGTFIAKYDTINDKRCKYDPANGYYGQFMWGPQYDKDGNAILGTNEYSGQQLNFTLDLPDMVNNKENAGARNVKYKPIAGALGLGNDFVIFRLAEVYFNLAEAQLRQSNTVENNVLSAINDIRIRAGVGTYNSSTLTLDELYDEKGREMCYELIRRTDMVRFGTFIQELWDKDYIDDASRNIFPIPFSARNINPNLKPNSDF